MLAEAALIEPIHRKTPSSITFPSFTVSAGVELLLESPFDSILPDPLDGVVEAAFP